MPHNLLLADDSVTIQRVIELTFADEDVDVFAVSDGDQAIARIEASPPDIVLAEIGMRGKNGYEVAEHVKQSPRLAHIPVLLLTGAFEPVDEAKAAAAGCEGVLAKPFEPQLVIGRVRELLAGGHRSLSSSTEPGPAPAAADAGAAAGGQSFWPMPADDAPIAAEPAGLPSDLDSYFDRLDEAFANLGTPAHAEPTPPAATIPSASAEIEADWFGNPTAPAADTTSAQHSAAPNPDTRDSGASLSYGSPLSEFDRLGELSSPAIERNTSFGADAFAPHPPDQAAAPDNAAGPGALEPQESALASSISEPPAEAPPASRAAEHVSPEHALSDRVISEPVVSAGAEAPTVPEHEETAEQVPAPAVASPTSPVIPVAPTPPAGLPTLADAFAALLAAENHDVPDAPVAWPSPASAPAVSDQLVEEVVERVLGRLSDRIVRETVGGLVPEIAERLIREEIERIKGAVR